MKKCPKKLIFHVWGAGAPLGGPIATKIIWEVPKELVNAPSKFEGDGLAKFCYPLKRVLRWQKACEKEANCSSFLGED